MSAPSPGDEMALLRVCTELNGVGALAVTGHGGNVPETPFRPADSGGRSRLPGD